MPANQAPDSASSVYSTSKRCEESVVMSSRAAHVSSSTNKDTTPIQRMAGILLPLVAHFFPFAFPLPSLPLYRS